MVAAHSCLIIKHNLRQILSNNHVVQKHQTSVQLNIILLKVHSFSLLLNILPLIHTHENSCDTFLTFTKALQNAINDDDNLKRSDYLFLFTCSSVYIISFSYRYSPKVMRKNEVKINNNSNIMR